MAICEFFCSVFFYKQQALLQLVHDCEREWQLGIGCEQARRGYEFDKPGRGTFSRRAVLIRQ